MNIIKSIKNLFSSTKNDRSGDRIYNGNGIYDGNGNSKDLLCPTCSYDKWDGGYPDKVIICSREN